MAAMLNISNQKIVILSLAIALLSACNSLITVKEKTSKPVSSQTTAKVEESTWQEAYGEPLAEQENILSEVPETEVEAESITPAPNPDLWQRIRDGFAISQPNLHADTQRQLQWFVNHPDYINRVVERARPYLHYIVDEIERRDMPLEIALLPVVESGFQPFAYSHGRAAGIWQFIPGTGRLYGLKQNWWYDGRRDIIESTRAALDYLQKLHNDFDDWQLALAAYNCGEGTVGRAIRRNKKAGKGIDFWSLDLPKETSAYVPKLMAVSELIKHPEKYELTLSSIDNSPFLTVVDVGGQIDLALAAKLAEISVDEMYQLNPGFNHWATTPDGPHRLVIPLEKADVFQQAMDDLPANKRVQWTRHKVKSGDSLGVLAAHYKTTIAIIKEANGIDSNRIRVGTHLLIPIASGKPSDYPLTVSQRLATRQNTPQRGSKKVHTVKTGDTWWDIARLYNVEVRKLTGWNNKAPGDILRPGQKLVVWTNGNPKDSNKKIRTVSYKIRSGDSLWKISQKFNVSIAQVREWNGLSNRSLLKPGQKLTLYVDVTQQHDSI